MNFDVNLIFLNSLFFLHEQNVLTKTFISWEQKKLLRQNKKHFSSFLKGFSVEDAQICLKQILRFQEHWSFQYKSSSMIPVKTYLDDEAHFFLAELLQKYNLYLLIMNVTTKM